MRTAHGAAFRSSFVAQIRDSGFGFLRRLLSTTNSKSAEFCFSLNWPTNRPVLRYGTTPRRFCGQDFWVGIFCSQEYFATDRFVARFFLRTRDLCVRFVEARSRLVKTVARISFGRALQSQDL